MSILRLTQSVTDSNKLRVDAILERAGTARLAVSSEFDFAVTEQDREDLRWYLEDYLQYASDPAPTIANRIEKRIAELGRGLFHAVFQNNAEMQDLWTKVHPNLKDTRIEIITEALHASVVPWELLRDSKTDLPLALCTKAFVRASRQPAQVSPTPIVSLGPIRILLVISRPGGVNDVPFRSVATRIIRGLGKTRTEAFELTVLRPPTFERLNEILVAAKRENSPFHIVHFDGHGTYIEGPAPSRSSSSCTEDESSNGYIIFENPTNGNNALLIDGMTLGRLLADAGVPILVLNACRSAHAEAPSAPETISSENSSSAAVADSHSNVRAFSSLAERVVNAGVPGVVAMRYNVYVVTAAQFVANLYAALANGLPLGEAVTLSRMELSSQPKREIAYVPRVLQDWMVPIVYESTEFVLFAKTSADSKPVLAIKVDNATNDPAELDPELKREPDKTFYGRDETLLALDRSFDTQPIILLHAYAGSGKTSTACEFARWYHLTGGIEERPFFTSFEQRKPLLLALNDVFGRGLAGLLDQLGIRWESLHESQKRHVALQIMTHHPILWLWDNVEPINGFPAGRASAWSDSEQEELADFLRAARNTRSKILLTSRRDERAWLKDLPYRIKMPAMATWDRIQLARDLARKHGQDLLEVATWLPLLRFSDGNPMILLITVGQALREGLRTKDQIENLVTLLREGGKPFQDEEMEGRSASLSASLSYGFEHAFSQTELRQVAILYLFHGTVDAPLLAGMGAQEFEDSLPTLHGLTADAAIGLLTRATEIGLLTRRTKTSYAIHPALPWFLNDLFDQYYPFGSELRTQAYLAFVFVIYSFVIQCSDAITSGDTGLMEALGTREPEIRHALKIARDNGWSEQILLLLRGVEILYEHQRRRLEWASLIREVLPAPENLDAAGIVPERQYIFIRYYIGVFCDERRWQDAEHWQRKIVAQQQSQIQPWLSLPKKELSEDQQGEILSVGTLLENLAGILTHQSKAECIDIYIQAIELFKTVDASYLQARCALNLGDIYMTLPGSIDISRSIEWISESLRLRDAYDIEGRALCFSQLGQAILTTVESTEPNDIKERFDLLAQALEFGNQALALLSWSPQAGDALAKTHYLLARLYGHQRNTNKASVHFRQALEYAEDDQIGVICHSFAQMLLDTANSHEALQDALAYANRALNAFESMAVSPLDLVKITQNLIRQITQRLNS